MGNLENLKIGALEGLSAILVLVAVILGVVAIVAVLIVSAIKAVKEHRDELEDKKEDEFFAEYGITGEQMRLNQELSEKRALLLSQKRIREELLDQQHIVIVHDHDTVEVPVEMPVEQPVEEPVEQPVEEKVEESLEPVVEETIEPAADTLAEPAPEETVVEEPAPVEEEPVVEEPAPVEEQKEEEKKPEPVAPPKKPDDWSQYDGEYEGLYYDPEDACYYEGTPSPELAEKLAQKQKELEEEAKKNRREVIVKKVTPPFLALKTPKNPRQTPNSVDGFDLAIIYGKYIIEHVDKEDGTQEWFYTLYNPSGDIIYMSSNYREREYCRRAITRFQTHVLVGDFLVEAADKKFYFELRRKTYVHKGEPQDTFQKANEFISQVKSYAQTDIIREQ